MNRLILPGCAAVLLLGTAGHAQQTPQQGQRTQSPSEDPEQLVGEASKTPDTPATTVDRPVYSAIQQAKKDLYSKYGLSIALEDTLIYQAASGGIDPHDAMVNTLGLFATWKIYRSQNEKDFAGPGFQFETRGEPLGSHHFTDMTNSLGTLWSPNDSTSDDYSKINQLWWGMKMADGKLGLQIGKIDPGSIINANRFAGSGNTQFFGQPFATNPARSFPDNGLGAQLRAEPFDWLYVHGIISDSDAASTHSPFTSIHGHWFYGGEIGVTPVIPGLGQGRYRLMLYERDLKESDEFGWALSFDQNLGEDYGVFLRFGDNDGGINAIKRIGSTGFSWLRPFGRKDDQAGVGFSYTNPSNKGLREEYSTDVFYRLQVTEGFQLSVDTQVIFNPSASQHDVDAVFGVRARLLY